MKARENTARVTRKRKFITGDWRDLCVEELKGDIVLQSERRDKKIGEVRVERPQGTVDS